MPRFLWRVTPFRAILEGWVVGILLYLLTQSALSDAPGLVISNLFILISAVSGSTAALRTQLEPAPLKQVLFKEILWAIGFSTGLVLIFFSLLAILGQLNFPQQSSVGALICYFFLGLSGPGILFVRVCSWIYRKWDQMRRTRFAWALTDAHIKLIIVIGLLGLFAGVIYFLQIQPDSFAGRPATTILTQIIIWTFTLLLGGILFAMAAMLVTLPVSAIFSYLISRRMTQRLEKLSRAATALRSGDLSSRVDVRGEDELARLQTDFNAMAADLQQSTRALAEEKDKVTALLQSQRELTAAVSHELRTPASVIHGYLDSLRIHWKNAEPESIESDLNILTQETQRLEEILNDLLAISQAEAGKLSLVLHPTDLSAVLQKAVHTTAALAWESQKVEIVYEKNGEIPLIQADALRLEQVLFNLIQNALRHTPPGGLITASIQMTDSFVRLEITDSGDGIAPEDLPHIWDKFYQSNHSLNRSSAGAGLGLALVKEFCEAMGAKVGVESILGEGSIFYILFPV